VFSALEGSRDEGVKPPVSLAVASQFQVIHPLLQGSPQPNIMVAVVRCRADGRAVYVDPILHPALEAADPLTDGIVQDFGRGRRDGIEAASIKRLWCHAG